LIADDPGVGQPSVMAPECLRAALKQGILIQAMNTWMHKFPGEPSETRAAATIFVTFQQIF
jgi:hypothetical protein